MTRLYGGGFAIIGAALVLCACDKVDAPLPSLKNEIGHFRPAQNAPESRFGPAGENSSALDSDANSNFTPTSADASEFRLAEVPPSRLEETRSLLTELDAKKDADQAIRFSLPADILFDFDKASLRPDALQPLRKAKQLVAAYPKAPVTIIGYTDAKGDDAYNDRLSMARARTVSASLMEGDNRHAIVKGLGKRDPVAPNARPDGNDDPEGRQRNRRVEIILSPVSKAEKG
ncbi:outer membrane protein OmpA-like peptidoglycan-associated protein [Sphingobium sp. B2D3A]|uniref:OmpA family protein n=1 Tax=unclassified Sphingobium TaxID=2611147 RepID=UPI002224E4B0|nr:MULTISPECIES: OmpA family protein [unclassified Sphingobium]MCW2336045.1 outer membrane protein OmpA-like peptidoglycan-associated protein [Sphingobium sp. B2D3A]MCW2385804.1 outer membrane protein OmpA-like peptidoglycan-associated protein [Sphingobium sp. B2D3D]